MTLVTTTTINYVGARPTCRELLCERCRRRVRGRRHGLRSGGSHRLRLAGAPLWRGTCRLGAAGLGHGPRARPAGGVGGRRPVRGRARAVGARAPWRRGGGGGGGVG